MKAPQKGNLTYLEKSIIDFLISHLPERQALLLREQLTYLTLIRRIEYKNDIVTEVYPEQYGIIPQEHLLGRTEEFQLGHVKFKQSGVSYKSEVHMVMGQVFDISVRPKPGKKELNVVEFTDFEIDPELEKNIFWDKK